MEKVILVHYGELGLKGKNRRVFEEQLRKNIAIKLQLCPEKIKIQDKRIILPLPRQSRDGKQILRKLQEVFGISWFSLAYKIPSSLKIIKKLVKNSGIQFNKSETFAVRVKRADKTFPLSSIELEKILGKIVKEETKSQVDLKDPDKTLFVEITKNDSFLFFEKKSGLGGLPVGTGGQVLSLFSGGIDSPIAAWLLGKRGAIVHLVHFSAIPPEKVKQTKIGIIYHQLQKYLGQVKLFIVPYLHFQIAASQLPYQFARYEVLLFRRFMMKVAEELSRKYKIKALALGDNLSQVASQTLDNLAVTDVDRQLPIFRPLLGYDKQEIIELAKKIGTYESSIQPYKDCCSLLHKKPVTKGKWQIVKKAEKQLKIANLISDSLREVLIFEE